MNLKWEKTRIYPLLQTVLLIWGIPWRKHLLPGRKKLIKSTFLTITKPFYLLLLQAEGNTCCFSLSVGGIMGNTDSPGSWAETRQTRGRRCLEPTWKSVLPVLWKTEYLGLELPTVSTAVLFSARIFYIRWWRFRTFRELSDHLIPSHVTTILWLISSKLTILLVRNTIKMPF